MQKKGKEGTIFDPKIWDFFENWIIESGIRLRFNTATFYVEKRKIPPSGWREAFCQRMGLTVQNEETILHVVTNKPGKLKGADSILFRRYCLIFTDKHYVEGIDRVEMHEVKDQEKLLEGIQRKLKND